MGFIQNKKVNRLWLGWADQIAKLLKYKLQLNRKNIGSKNKKTGQVHVGPVERSNIFVPHSFIILLLPFMLIWVFYFVFKCGKSGEGAEAEERIKCSKRKCGNRELP